MTGGELLERIGAAGAAASLGTDGRVRVAGVSRLPAGLLDLLRDNKAALAAALEARGEATADQAAEGTPVAPDPGDAARGFAALRDAEPDPIAGAEREAIQAEPTLESYRQRTPHEAMVAGLLAGDHWASGRLALVALARRLETLRPKREHGIRDLDREACHVAARAAAELPDAAWSAWRATLGTAAAGWPPRPPGPPSNAGAHR